jgi:hypothetical protein
MLGFLLCGILVWLAWVVYSGFVNGKSAPLARVPLPADEMREVANVTVISKAFVSSLTEEGRWVEGSPPERHLAGDHIRISGEVTNSGTRDILALRGHIMFSDLFGDEIKSVAWTYEHGVKAGEHKHYETGLVYDSVIPDDQKLRTTPLANMKVRWDPQAIVFADGKMLGK